MQVDVTDNIAAATYCCRPTMPHPLGSWHNAVKWVYTTLRVALASRFQPQIRHAGCLASQPFSTPSPSKAMAPSVLPYDLALCLGANLKLAGAGPSSISLMRTCSRQRALQHMPLTR